MSNMSYCRFENTYRDMEDCKEALDELFNYQQLSESELRYAKKLCVTCAEILSAVADSSVNTDVQGLVNDHDIISEALDEAQLSARQHALDESRAKADEK